MEEAWYSWVSEEATPHTPRDSVHLRKKSCQLQPLSLRISERPQPLAFRGVSTVITPYQMKKTQNCNSTAIIQRRNFLTWIYHILFQMVSNFRLNISSSPNYQISRFDPKLQKQRQKKHWQLSDSGGQRLSPTLPKAQRSTHPHQSPTITTRDIVHSPLRLNSKMQAANQSAGSMQAHT